MAGTHLMLIASHCDPCYHEGAAATSANLRTSPIVAWTMDPNATVRTLRAAIAALEPDAPIVRPGKWFKTQHEHWLGWLDAYDGPGAYGRATPSPTDARTVYNRIVDPEMLIYLAAAAGVDDAIVNSARRVVATASSKMQAAGRVRRLVPWETVARALPEPRRGRWFS